MRFQVFDGQGNLIYDSGVMAEPELKWNLRNGNGGELAGGLYAYKLAIKEQGKEAAQENRVHFIIERADERKSDRLWITSQAATGVGREHAGRRSDSRHKQTRHGCRSTPGQHGLRKIWRHKATRQNRHGKCE